MGTPLHNPHELPQDEAVLRGLRRLGWALAAFVLAIALTVLA